LVTVSFSVHVSHAYVTTGLISEKYNVSFAILDISLLWNIRISGTSDLNGEILQKASKY
jgi:hypothetical protein